MSELILWKDQEIRKLRRDLDRLFTQLWAGFGSPPFPGDISGGPSLDLSETADALTLRAELPGIDPAELEISVSNNSLTLRGEKSEESVAEGRRYYKVERRYGTFSRTLRLPCQVEVDDIEATYKNGILNIVMPKSKTHKGQCIKVQVE